jgi:hypothetical protein
MKHWRGGQEPRLTPDEALDLAYAIRFMVHELDPGRRGTIRGGRPAGDARQPAPRLIRGGAAERT